MKKLFMCIAMLSVAAISGYAQSAVATAGGDATGDGSVSFTVGQTVFTTVANENGSISQGVQQAYEITTETGIDVTEIQLSAFPNPTSDVLNLTIDGDFGKVTYALFNNSSALLAKGTANGPKTQIQMGAFKPGVYFLEVKAEGKTVKRFKVVKN